MNTSDSASSGAPLLTSLTQRVREDLILRNSLLADWSTCGGGGGGGRGRACEGAAGDKHCMRSDMLRHAAAAYTVGCLRACVRQTQPQPNSLPTTVMARSGSRTHSWAATPTPTPTPTHWRPATPRPAHLGVAPKAGSHPPTPTPIHSDSFTAPRPPWCPSPRPPASTSSPSPPS